MCSQRALFACLTLALAGCSAIINPDSDRFGDVEPGEDAGPGVLLMDAGDVDAAGFDAGPRPGDDAGPGPGDDAGCAPARCEEGVLTTCDGTVTCPLGCAGGSGAPRCAEMIPSNVSADLWRPGAPDLDLSTTGQVLFDTDECSAMSAMSMVVPQMGGGGEVCVLIVRSLRVRSGSALRPVGGRPLVIMASDEVRIDANGAIDASTYFTGDGDRALGAGGALGGRPGRSAGGAAPGGDGTHRGEFDDGGGGGGAFCGAGGDGGDGGGGAPGGEGGPAMPGELLTPLRGGSAGGYGPGAIGSITPGGAGNVGFGGGGGGALQISTPGRIIIDGFLAAGGGGGLGGRNGSGNWGSGGGGGSGGGILLEAPEIRIGTEWAITTTGGGGGGGASSSGNGGNGGNGVETLGRAPGGAEGGFRYGADGGDSGGGADDDALPGETNTGGSANGGGGGGGVGCIAVRTADGSLPTGFAARVSGRSGGALRSAPVMRR